MSILGPVLMAALIVVPALLATMNSEEEKTVAVVDYSNKFKESFKDKEKLKFEFVSPDNVENLKLNFAKSKFYALLILPDSITSNSIQLLSDMQPDINTKTYINSVIEGKLRSEKLIELGIDEKKLNAIDISIDVKTIKIKSDGSEEISSTEIIMGIGFIMALIIYMFIFIYGAQVMRGVIEEKTNRVVEILVSSVKPFQLMMGKIVGIAMVAFTQFALWTVLTITIVSIVQIAMGSTKIAKTPTEQMVQSSNLPIDAQKADQKGDFLSDAISTLANLPFGLMIFGFIFYFLGGYLLYASLFAAIGSAVDNETDTQQFMLPLTIPLILAFVMAQFIIQNPDGPVAFWFSIIPFTSPIVMLMRIPFGVPAWELILSMSLLAATFIGTTWLAGKIFRIGILMYGKKLNYKELWKWLKYDS